MPEKGFSLIRISRIKTESRILSLYERIRVSENLYSRIFYAVISIPESFVRPRGAKTIICIILRYLNEYNTISAPQVAHLMANYI